MKLDPGYYKVKRTATFFAQSSFHYMRVFYDGKRKYFQVDNMPPEEIRGDDNLILEDFQLIKKLTKARPIKVLNLKVALYWKDEDGSDFKMLAFNKSTLEYLFRLFPRVRKEFEE